jgi:diadenosine tetraphosphate (Ap4A) HIT family hydrolase
MKWKSPQEWAKLKAGIDCPMCLESGMEENQHSYKVIELKQSIVRFNKNQYMPGWTTLILKRHVTELFELSPEERAGFWDEVSIVAKALYQIYNPAKINYCIWGNHMPHIHCHLFTQTFDDDPGKPINQNEKEIFLDKNEYLQKIKKITYEIHKTTETKS